MLIVGGHLEPMRISVHKARHCRLLLKQSLRRSQHEEAYRDATNGCRRIEQGHLGLRTIEQEHLQMLKSSKKKIWKKISRKKWTMNLKIFAVG
ncbi:hypothetical protein M514_28030 [Trichuris suis]|uniref:Uncharacterized protein n=1 Tax=Trichuris suis TaxID=68888 RepID=A0A085MRE3_9BILA|nr:hypothetical protein M514_28030 [Trichuris suis]